MAPVREEQPRQPSGVHVRVLCDRLIRVSRETRSPKQRSIRGLRRCEEALNTGQPEVRDQSFGDSSVDITPRGSQAMLCSWSATFHPMARNIMRLASNLSIVRTEG